MMTFKSFAAVLSVAIAPFAVAAAAVAGPGHDHAQGAVPTAGAALPRFAATSEAFELVGVLNGTQLTLYLDRATDNSPVRNAKLDLELGGSKVDVTAQGEGEFAVMLPRAPEPGLISIAAAVQAGSESDLLAGELDLRAVAHVQAVHARSWREYAVWIASGLAVLALALWGARRLLRRRTRAGGAA
jgi:hypothetical protein